MEQTAERERLLATYTEENIAAFLARVEREWKEQKESEGGVSLGWMVTKREEAKGGWSSCDWASPTASEKKSEEEKKKEEEEGKKRRRRRGGRRSAH